MGHNRVDGENIVRIVSSWIASVAEMIKRYRDQLPAIAAGICVFVGSTLLAPFYIDGDQRIYHHAYQVVEGLDWANAYYLYARTIMGGEYSHFIVSWIASTLAIEKSVAMALANSMLAAYSVVLLRRWGASLYVALFVVLTNYYWYVLYFPAERLKVGVLFMVLSLLSIGRGIAFPVFSAAALFAHNSLIFIYSGIWLMMAASFLRRSESALRNQLILLSGGGVLIVSVLLLGRIHIEAKLPTYLAVHNVSNVWALGPVLILVGLSCIYSKKIIEPALLYLPTILGIAFLGGSRLNMLAYFIFLYHCLQVRNGFNIGVVTTSIYCCYKSIGFVSNVIEYGHGFP
jgi:hypothetical protein